MYQLLPILLFCAAAAAADSDLPYVLAHPGVAFEWLPPELAEPVEGLLGEDEGIVVSGPSSTGVEYHILYWEEEIPQGAARSEWLTTRLPALLPPDASGTWRFGDVQWVEGSRLTNCRSSLSMGLMPFLNFNIVAESGAVLGRGRAYGAFRQGYSILLYCLAPEETSLEAISSLEGMVHMMHLVEGS